MARDIDRKALKEDAFRDTAFWLIDWAYQRRAILIAAGTVVLLAVAGGAGYYYYRESMLTQQSERFHEAERAGMAPADLSADESQARVRKAFEGFVAQYPDSPLAPPAWMNVARLAWKASDRDAARAAFQHVRDHPEASPALRNLAQIGLAKLDEAEGRLDQAAAEYQGVSDGIFDELKALSLGRVAALQDKNEEARQYFEKAARGTDGTALAEWARQQLDYHP